MTFTIGSLATGTGMLDMAASWALGGGELSWYAEPEEWACRVLTRHHPRVPNLGNLEYIDWSMIPPVDVLTAGFPCPPYSLAGKRKMEEDERDTWPEVADAIRNLRPRLTVLENVPGIRSGGFGRVLGDMAEAGFHVRWTSLFADVLGAPHRRERVFVCITPDADSLGSLGQKLAERPEAGASGSELCRPLLSRSTVDPADFSVRAEFGIHYPAVQRWESETRPAPAPVVLNRNGRRQINVRFSEWMMGMPDGWVTDTLKVPRYAQLQLIGNAVVPQQARQAIQDLVKDLL